MNLEAWLHATIHAAVAQGTEGDCLHPAAANPAAPAVSRAAIEAYQSCRVRRTLEYACLNSAFYRTLYNQAGIAPAHIRDLNDLQKLPCTDPKPLSEEPYRFLCLSRAAVARAHTFITSGTTGPQKKIFWTSGDLERIIRFMAAGIGSVADRTDVVQICLPDGPPYSQADLLARGVARIGAHPDLAGTELGAEEHLRRLRESRPTILFGYTHHLLRLTRALQSRCDLRRMGVRVLFLAAQYVPESLRRQLQELWDCRVYTHYGLTEMGLGVAIECSAGNGYHFNEADLYLEIVDPHTLQRVGDGQEGELVFTTLNREAMPLIRYRTHDISRWIMEPCPCGAHTLRRFAAVRKRLETMVTLKNGATIYPALLDDVLLAIPGLVDYQAILRRQGQEERLDFVIELTEKSPARIPEILHRLRSAPVLAAGLQTGAMAAPDIQLVDAGALTTASRAKRLIVDKR